jgi:hypothetical protein
MISQTIKWKITLKVSNLAPVLRITDIHITSKATKAEINRDLELQYVKSLNSLILQLK